MDRRLITFIFFTSAYFLSYFFRSANAVISADLSSDLALTPGQLGFMTSIFFATFAAVQIPVGIGLDRYGPRWITPGLLLVGVVGSLMFASAQSFVMVTVGRGLIGIGMSGCLMGSLKALSQWYPVDRFATVSGLLIGIGSSGALFAASPLAWLNNLYGWRAIFVGMAIVTALIAVSIMIFTRNTPPGVEWPTPAAREGGIGLILKDLRFWRFALISLFAIGTLQAFLGLWAGPYLFDVYQLSDISGGNILLLIGIGSTVGFLTNGWVADRFELKQVVLYGSILFILTQIALALSPPLIAVVVLFFLFGYGGTFCILLMAEVRKMFPDSMTGQATSALNLFGFAGTFLIQWILGIVIGSFEATPQGQYPPNAYLTALVLTGITTALALAFYYPMTVKSAQSKPVLSE